MRRSGLPAPLRILGAVLGVAVLGAASGSIAACAPEVGSERWCEQMREKPRGDWTANEAVDFTRHCIFETDE